MDLTIERFDLDPRVREPNTDRHTPKGAPFPTGFPFVVDDETQRIVEPIALHLANKFNGNSAYLGAMWTKLNSADAAASDLKAWWTFIHDHPAKPDWDDISDRFLGSYLQALTRAPSDQTSDFLKPETIKRHCSSIDAFNDFARVKWPNGTFPSMDAAKILAGVNGRRKEHPTDEVPHPLAELLPAIIILTTVFGLNPGVVQGMRHRIDYRTGTSLGRRRLFMFPLKDRGTPKAQRNTVVATEDGDNPARVIRYIEERTSFLRGRTSSRWRIERVERARQGDAPHATDSYGTSRQGEAPGCSQSPASHGAAESQGA